MKESLKTFGPVVGILTFLALVLIEGLLPLAKLLGLGKWLLQ